MQSPMQAYRDGEISAEELLAALKREMEIEERENDAETSRRHARRAERVQLGDVTMIAAVNLVSLSKRFSELSRKLERNGEADRLGEAIMDAERLLGTLKGVILLADAEHD